MDQDKREVAAWTPELAKTLAQEYQRREVLLRGRLTQQLTTRDKHKAWEEILDAVNSESSTRPFTMKQVENKIKNLIQRCKEKLDKANKQNRATGGGPHEVIDFSQAELILAQCVATRKSVRGLQTGMETALPGLPAPAPTMYMPFQPAAAPIYNDEGFRTGIETAPSMSLMPSAGPSREVIYTDEDGNVLPAQLSQLVEVNLDDTADSQFSPSKLTSAATSSASLPPTSSNIDLLSMLRNSTVSERSFVRRKRNREEVELECLRWELQVLKDRHAYYVEKTKLLKRENEAANRQEESRQKTAED